MYYQDTRTITEFGLNLANSFGWGKNWFIFVETFCFDIFETNCFHISRQNGIFETKCFELTQMKIFFLFRVKKNQEQLLLV